MNAQTKAILLDIILEHLVAYLEKLRVKRNNPNSPTA